jgi:hypothetical protein
LGVGGVEIVRKEEIYLVRLVSDASWNHEIWLLVACITHFCKPGIVNLLKTYPVPLSITTVFNLIFYLLLFFVKGQNFSKYKLFDFLLEIKSLDFLPLRI